jgi:hypothetical protein
MLRRGIEVHAWFVVTPLWDTAARPPAAPNHVFSMHRRYARRRECGSRSQRRDRHMRRASAPADVSVKSRHRGAPRVGSDRRDLRPVLT